MWLLAIICVTTYLGLEGGNTTPLASATQQTLNAKRANNWK